ncbi:MAG: Stp1/IreP family PP2C-type Ser/Thr phosphatase [Bdellovibrionales bacterium]|nr:Stp1/IreP family PP2C-type Ser/Thr phosphatase [Bdellovibrionales bacterium]
MKLNVWGQTDVGLKREINQDTVMVDKELGLYIVADGMGGHSAGEVASAMAVETVQEVVRERSHERKDLSLSILVDAYKEACRRIYYRSENEKELTGMGTTMVGFWHRDEKIYVANVGDSRLYLFRNPNMWQLTEDHSLIQEQIKAGVISEEEAPNVVGRNVITRSIGFEREVNVDTLERELMPGDMYLLCSDGLSGLVPDKKIAELCKNRKPAAIVADCIAAARENGGDDNISVILVQVEEI